MQFLVFSLKRFEESECVNLTLLKSYYGCVLVEIYITQLLHKIFPVFISIGSYWVRIGSIEASGDDFSTNLGTSLSLSVPNIDVMHGRDVYVSVVATNEQGMDSQPALCPKFTANRRGILYTCKFPLRKRSIESSLLPVNHNQNTHGLQNTLTD